MGGPLLGTVGVCVRARAVLASAVGCALAALFIRELAAPYCVVGTLLALRNAGGAGRRGWLTGAAAYARVLRLARGAGAGAPPADRCIAQGRMADVPRRAVPASDDAEARLVRVRAPALESAGAGAADRGIARETTPRHLRATASADLRLLPASRGSRSTTTGDSSQLRPGRSSAGMVSRRSRKRSERCDPRFWPRRPAPRVSASSSAPA